MFRIGLNTNLAALSAQRRLANAIAAHARPFARLASGLRINRSSDDAAGLSIAQGLNVDYRVYTQGIRNLNDGVALLNIAAGALDQLSIAVTRMRELATQASNGTLSHAQRTVLDQEAQQLSDEYHRIARTTRFNDSLLFARSFGPLQLQAGYGPQGAIMSALGGTVGTGAFTRSDSMSLGSDPRGVATADLNRDGFLDVVTGSDDDFVTVALGNGDGTFGPAVNIYSGGAAPESVAVSDLNGDGFYDIVAAHHNDSTVGILLGTGNGTFLPVHTVDVGTGPADVIVADFDGNGVPDIGTADSGGDTVSVLLGLNNGSFLAPQYLDLSAFGSPGTLRAGDFNGDGVQDIATTANGAVTISYGNGDGTFSDTTEVDDGVVSRGITVGDINGDGLDDVIIGAPDDGSDVYVAINQGDAAFTVSVMTSLALNEVFGLALGDFNGDGILDLTYGDLGSARFNVHIGTGQGQFSAHATYMAGGSSLATLGIGDVNNDGVLDILGIDTITGALHAFVGNTTAGIGALLPVDLSQRFSALDALDYLDRALNIAARQRGVIGGLMSRIETGISNLRQAAESYRMAEHRITDADIAAEAADLVRQRVIHEASAAVLSQANQAPELALRLLEG